MTRYPRSTSVRLPIVALAGVLAVVGCRAATPRVGDPASASFPDRPRAIVVSFDAFNERRVVETVDPARIPAIRALFAEGECAASLQPAFPSVTAAGHAAIWTGAYGNENGIAANTVLRLPASRFTILETTDGFRAPALRAEPIWITAALAGRTVFAHHVTQAPQPPGYPVDDGEPADTFAVARRRAGEALALPRLSVLNGYNRVLLAPRLLTRGDVQLTAPGAWRGLSPVPGSEALEFTIDLSSDSLVRGAALYALLRRWPLGDSAQFFVGTERDLSTAVRVLPHAEERAPVRGRALARWFSAPVVVPLADGRRASMRLRLFALSARDTSFTLFVPGMQLADANRATLTGDYDAAVPGWVGNSAISLWETGGLGRTLMQGGDGVAEWRWLESAELLARGYLEGSAWGWRTMSPDLMLDYFPLGDDTDHALWGLLDSRAPGYDTTVAARARAVRDRMWELVDLRLAGLMALARQQGRTRLYVAGDHGMRAEWRTFRPNAALREAGLLVLDRAGHIDLSQSRAASANGYWISVNRMGRRGGIVPETQVGAVMDEVRRALLAVRDEWGRAVVTRVIDRRDPQAHALGIGGATGGDVYYDLADGYAWLSDAEGAVVGDASHATGGHGFPSTSSDMHSASCSWLPGATGAARAGVQRQPDIARAVTRWLGITPAR